MADQVANVNACSGQWVSVSFLVTTKAEMFRMEPRRLQRSRRHGDTDEGTPTKHSRLVQSRVRSRESQTFEKHNPVAVI